MFFFWIILAFAAGIILASLLTLSPLLWGVGAILFALIAILSRKYSFLASPPARRHWLLSAWVLLAALAAGGLRYALAQPTFTPQDLAWYNDRGEFQITAVVTKTSDHRSDATYLTLSARELYDPVSQQFRRISGTFLARTGVNAAWQLGDELQFIAKPLTPSENDGFHIALIWPGKTSTPSFTPPPLSGALPVERHPGWRKAWNGCVKKPAPPF